MNIEDQLPEIRQLCKKISRIHSRLWHRPQWADFKEYFRLAKELKERYKVNTSLLSRDIRFWSEKIREFEADQSEILEDPYE